VVLVTISKFWWHTWDVGSRRQRKDEIKTKLVKYTQNIHVLSYHQDFELANYIRISWRNNFVYNIRHQHVAVSLCKVKIKERSYWWIFSLFNWNRTCHLNYLVRIKVLFNSQMQNSSFQNKIIETSRLTTEKSTWNVSQTQKVYNSHLKSFHKKSLWFIDLCTFSYKLWPINKKNPVYHWNYEHWKTRSRGL